MNEQDMLIHFVLLFLPTLGGTVAYLWWKNRQLMASLAHAWACHNNLVDDLDEADEQIEDLHAMVEAMAVEADRTNVLVCDLRSRLSAASR